MPMAKGKKAMMRKTKSDLADMVLYFKEQAELARCEASAQRSLFDSERATNERLLSRIERISCMFETFNENNLVKVVSKNVEVHPESWGKYMVLSELDDEIIQGAKNTLIHDVAKGLVESGLVQFIIHEDRDTPLMEDNTKTVGVKLFVVPWEQMCRRKYTFARE